jgi:hypothetical protein
VSSKAFSSEGMECEADSCGSGGAGSMEAKALLVVSVAKYAFNFPGISTN